MATAVTTQDVTREFGYGESWFAVATPTLRREAEDRIAQAATRIEAALAAMPALAGTEKQVAWATDIRARAVLLTVTRDDGEARVARRLNAFGQRAEAAWWIDHRGADRVKLTRLIEEGR